MKTNFLTGASFGIALGIIIAIAIPMNAATDIKLNKSSRPALTTKQAPGSTTEVTETDSGMKDVLAVLKEMNKNIKEQTNQNSKIISELHQLNDRFNTYPTPTPTPQ
jgi:hypothetical protein